MELDSTAELVLLGTAQVRKVPGSISQAENAGSIPVTRSMERPAQRWFALRVALPKSVASNDGALAAADGCRRPRREAARRRRMPWRAKGRGVLRFARSSSIVEGPMHVQPFMAVDAENPAVDRGTGYDLFDLAG